MTLDRLYRIWLGAKAGISPRCAGRLLAHFGSPVHIYAAARPDYLACPGVRPAQAELLCDKDLAQAERIAADCERLGISIVTLGDREYPALLRTIPDPPQLLFVKGRLPDFARYPGIGIVGTRDCSDAARTQAQKFGAALSAAGFTVVTGLALGVDGAANEGALFAGRPSIGVFAGGVDKCYPRQHRALMEEVCRTGAVISEMPPGTQHISTLFPKRNRIISGLAAAVLAIEAPARSGTLITARNAVKQGRPLFVLPGQVGDPHAAGTNLLLRDGTARAAFDPMDLVQALSDRLPVQPNESYIRAIYAAAGGAASVESTVSAKPAVPAKPAASPAGRNPSASDRVRPTPPDPRIAALNDDERAVARLIAEGLWDQDELLARAGLPARRVMNALAALEFEGFAQETDGRLRLTPALLQALRKQK